MSLAKVKKYTFLSLILMQRGGKKGGFFSINAGIYRAQNFFHVEVSCLSYEKM